MVALPRKIRLYYLVARELAKKYTRFLFFGFFIGLVASIFFWRSTPFLTSLLFTHKRRVAIVGEFTPSSLPLSIQNQISMGLTRIGADGKPEPALAESWEATNSGKTFIFTLRKDLKWHSGRQVVSNDVNYNIRGVTFTPKSPTTIIANLQYAYSPFPSLVSKPIFEIGLKGFGDYSVRSIQLQGDAMKSLTLQPYGSASGQMITYRFYRTEAQAQTAFQLGEVDEIEELSSLGSIAKWGSVKIEESSKYDRIVSLFFNLKNPLFSDKTVRQALAYGVPDLPYERAFSPISKESWVYTDTVRKYMYDEKQALKLISNSQLSSMSGELVISTFAPYLDTAEAIAKSWTNLGVPAKTQVVNAVSPDYEVLISAQDLSPDPDQYLFWHSTQHTTNITGYQNVKIDKLLEDGRIEIDPENRRKIYQDFQKRIVEDSPAIFLYYPKVYTITRGK